MIEVRIAVAIATRKLFLTMPIAPNKTVINHQRAIVAASIAAMALLMSAGCAVAQTDDPACISDSRVFLAAYDKWKENMISGGNATGKLLLQTESQPTAVRLQAQYYDAGWIFRQISDFVGEQQPWRDYENAANSVYLNEYLIPNEFGAQGFRRFPHGFFMALNDRSEISQETFKLLRDKPAYSAPRTLINFKSGGAERLSREVAYALQANIYAEKVGLPRKFDGEGNPRIAFFLRWAANHLYEWRHQKFEGGAGDGRVSPFMFALTAHALIEYRDWELENGRDPAEYWPTSLPLDYHGRGLSKPEIRWTGIEEAITEVAQWLAEEATMQSIPTKRLLVTERGGYTAFRYEDIGKSGPSPDLNLLVAPIYAWVYAQSGELKYREVADKLFITGVEEAYLKPGKHFNQNYRLSFLFHEWRYAGDEKYRYTAECS